MSCSSLFRNKKDNTIVTSGLMAMIGATKTTGALDKARYQQETPNAEAQPAPSIYRYPDTGDLPTPESEFLPNMTPVIINPNNNENPDTIIGDANSVVIILPNTAMSPYIAAAQMAKMYPLY